jgi:hypothetical protein
MGASPGLSESGQKTRSGSKRWLIVAAGVLLLAAAAIVFSKINSETALEGAYAACSGGKNVASYAQLGDGGSSLILDGPGEESSTFEDSLTFTNCILDSLETPDYVRSKMESTTSLMGNQEAEWDNLQASWSFHPDNGFDVVLHTK